MHLSSKLVTQKKETREMKNVRRVTAETVEFPKIESQDRKYFYHKIEFRSSDQFVIFNHDHKIETLNTFNLVKIFVNFRPWEIRPCDQIPRPTGISS